MKFLSQILKDKPKSFYFLWGFVSLLFLYTLTLFFYLKIVGVYGIATLTEAVSTSDGIVFTYEFTYEGEMYTGTFTGGVTKRNLGDKYFVSFSKSHPGMNLLQYNSPVPDCFKDSVNSYWTTLPKCVSQ